jgi:hypothetical protein
MKIIRYFLCREWHEVGVMGFTPLWIPKSCGFDPSEARGMMHDMLEHRLSDRGKFHEEVMAFGRIIALRAMPGFGFDRGGYRPDKVLGMELAGIFARGFENSGEPPTIERAPETGFAENYAENFIEEMVKSFKQSIASELQDRFDESVPLPGASLYRSLASWLRIGYIDAIRRYGQLDHGCYDVGYAGHLWAEENAKRISRLVEEADGSVMRLCFDTKSLRIQETLIEPDREYGRLPTWLRARVHWWHMA